MLRSRQDTSVSEFDGAYFLFESSYFFTNIIFYYDNFFFSFVFLSFLFFLFLYEFCISKKFFEFYKYIHAYDD